MRWLIVLAFVAACGGEPVRSGGPSIDVDRALATVTHLATTIGPRAVNSAAAAQTAVWIEAELAAMQADIETLDVGSVDLPAITVLGTTWRDAHRATITTPNILAHFGPATGKPLLVMAHYDSVADSPGGVDNAAAVGVLLELARVLQRDPPPHPVILAFTAGEEVGLVGAEALAAELAERVGFVISLDLIGGDGTLVVNGASELVGIAELRWLLEGAASVGVDVEVPLIHRVISRWWPQAERSDHGPFTRRGTRAVHFYNRGHDGEWIDLAYHSTHDTAARVARTSVDDLARLLLALIASPPPAPDVDGFAVPFTRTLVVSRSALVLFELVLVLVTLLALAFSRSGLVAYLTRTQEPVRGAGLAAGAVCFALAGIATIAVEELVVGDHLAPWTHAPARAALGSALILAGTLGLATRLVGRFIPWRGEGRYLAVAALLPLTIGTAWLVVGAAELAWVWLIPAALIALAPALPLPALTRPLAVIVTALPAVLVLHPYRLREAVWNGFLPVTIPLAALVVLFALPPAAAIAYLLRARRTAPGPLGTLGLGVGCGLIAIGGFVLAITTPTPCTAQEFMSFLLACERV